MNLLVCCFCPAFAKAIKSVSSEVLAVGAHTCPTMGSPEILAVGVHMSHTMDSSSEQHKSLAFLSLGIVMMEANTGGMISD